MYLKLTQKGLSSLIFFIFFVCASLVNTATAQTCPKPTDLWVTTYTASSLTLTWNYNTRATGFTIRWCKDQIPYAWNTENVNTPFYTLTTLEQGKTYRIEVKQKCYDDSTASDFSDVLIFTHNGYYPPFNPETKQVEIIQAQLQWSLLTGVSQYQLRYKKKDALTWNNETITLTASDTGAVIFRSLDSLEQNQGYVWQVRAFYPDSQYSIYTDTAFFKTRGCLSPQAFKITNHLYKLHLDWEIPLHPLQSFDIAYRVKGSIDTTWQNKTVYPDTSIAINKPGLALIEDRTADTVLLYHVLNEIPGERAFVHAAVKVNNLDPNTTYEIKVRTDAGNNQKSLWTPVDSAQTFAVFYDCNITAWLNLYLADSGANFVTVKWNRDSTDSLLGLPRNRSYIVKYRLKNPTNPQPWTTLTGTYGDSVRINALQGLTNYELKIFSNACASAIDTLDVFDFTTDSCVIPPAPKHLVLTPSYGRMKADWEKTTDWNPYFVIELRDYQKNLLQRDTTNDTEQLYLNLEPDSLYYVSVWTICQTLTSDTLVDSLRLPAYNIDEFGVETYGIQTEQAQIMWNTYPMNTGGRVYWKSTGGVGGSWQNDTVFAGKSVFTLSNLTHNTEYEVKVRMAYGTDRLWDYPTDTFKTKKKGDLPRHTDFTLAYITDTSVKVSWTKTEPELSYTYAADYRIKKSIEDSAYLCTSMTPLQFKGWTCPSALSVNNFSVIIPLDTVEQEYQLEVSSTYQSETLSEFFTFTGSRNTEGQSNKTGEDDNPPKPGQPDPGGPGRRKNDFKIGMIGNLHYYGQCPLVGNGKSLINGDGMQDALSSFYSRPLTTNAEFTNVHGTFNTSNLNVLSEDGFNIIHPYMSGGAQRNVDLIKLVKNNNMEILFNFMNYYVQQPDFPDDAYKENNKDVSQLTFAEGRDHISLNNETVVPSDPLKRYYRGDETTRNRLPMYDGFLRNDITDLPNGKDRYKNFGSAPLLNLKDIFDAVAQQPGLLKTIWGVKITEEASFAHTHPRGNSMGRIGFDRPNNPLNPDKKHYFAKFNNLEGLSMPLCDAYQSKHFVPYPYYVDGGRTYSDGDETDTDCSLFYPKGTSYPSVIYLNTEIPPSVVKTVHDDLQAYCASKNHYPKIGIMEVHHGGTLDENNRVKDKHGRDHEDRRDNILFNKSKYNALDYLELFNRREHLQAFSLEGSYYGSKPFSYFINQIEAKKAEEKAPNFFLTTRVGSLDLKTIDFEKSKFNTVHNVIATYFDDSGPTNGAESHFHLMEQSSLEVNRTNKRNGNFMWLQTYASIIHGVTGIWFWHQPGLYRPSKYRENDTLPWIYPIPPDIKGSEFEEEYQELLDEEELRKKAYYGANRGTSDYSSTAEIPSTTNDRFKRANFPQIYNDYVAKLTQELRYLKERDLLSSDPNSILHAKTGKPDSWGILESAQGNQSYLRKALRSVCTDTDRKADYLDRYKPENNYWHEDGRLNYSPQNLCRNDGQYLADMMGYEEYGIRYTLRTNGKSVIMIAVNMLPIEIKDVTFDFHCIANRSILEADGIKVLFEDENSYTENKVIRSGADWQQPDDPDAIESYTVQDNNSSLPEYWDAVNRKLKTRFMPYDTRVFEFVLPEPSSNLANDDKWAKVWDNRFSGKIYGDNVYLTQDILVGDFVGDRKGDQILYIDVPGDLIGLRRVANGDMSLNGYWFNNLFDKDLTGGSGDNLATLIAQGNFNGDFRDHLIFKGGKYGAGEMYYDPEIQTFNFQRASYQTNTLAGWRFGSNQQYIVGDFDGNDKDEILAFVFDSSPFYTQLYKSDARTWSWGFSNMYENTNRGVFRYQLGGGFATYALQSTDRVYAADFNGNRKTEVVVFRPSTRTVVAFEYVSGNNTWERLFAPETLSTGAEDAQLLFGNIDRSISDYKSEMIVIYKGISEGKYESYDYDGYNLNLNQETQSGEHSLFDYSIEESNVYERFWLPRVGGTDVRRQRQLLALKSYHYLPECSTSIASNDLLALFSVKTNSPPYDFKQGSNSFSEDRTISQPEFTLFPNPTQTSVTLRFDLKELEQAQVKVLTLDGKTITTYSIGTSKGEIVMDVSGLSSGVYVCQIVCGKQNYHQKLVIMK